jgi:NAD-dependent SIR2 family protein deacetylase
MVTNYPQQLTATTTAHGTHDATENVVARSFGRLGQLLCGLRGHDSLLHVEGNRMNMRCTSCGYETPGWEISGRGPRRRYEGDARRHRLATQRLVLRKTA